MISSYILKIEYYNITNSKEVERLHQANIEKASTLDDSRCRVTIWSGSAPSITIETSDIENYLELMQLFKN